MFINKQKSNLVHCENYNQSRAQLFQSKQIIPKTPLFKAKFFKNLKLYYILAKCKRKNIRLGKHSLKMVVVTEKQSKIFNTWCLPIGLISITIFLKHIFQLYVATNENLV